MTETFTSTLVIQTAAYSTVTTTLGGFENVPEVVFTVELKTTVGDIVTWGLLLSVLCVYILERGSARMGRMLRSR